MRGSSSIRRRIPNYHYFSTSSGGGRGRSTPFTSNTFGFTPNQPDDSNQPDPPQPAMGRGRGRGQITSNPTLPSFSSFVSSLQNNPNPIGRAPADNSNTPPPDNSKLPDDIYSSLSGAGRGKPAQPVRPEVENRHLRPKLKAGAVGERNVGEEKGGEMNVGEARRGDGNFGEKKVGEMNDGEEKGGEMNVVEKKGREVPRPKMSKEEAVAQAMRVLASSGGGSGREAAIGGGRGRGRRGFEGRGRGRGRGRWGRDRDDVAGEEEYGGLYLGDNADGEKLAQRIGLDNMNKLVEGFEEMSGRLLPSPTQDAVLDALDTNFKIEFEEEYLMGEFDKNPELEEKEAMNIRNVLEKLKPFLMAYEGFRSQEEWEEAVEATMKNLPLFKEIVEHYSGPERITAKAQQEILESVAKTVPPSVPASAKQFANRAMLSIQSNPGWGFDKKYQFMDKLVSEVSRHYK